MTNFRIISVDPSISIFEAMKIIDEQGTQFVMVLDKNARLLGVVTDGDIRRGILHGSSLKAPVTEIMNTHPRTLSDNASRIDGINFLRENKITHVPLVNELNIVTGVISLNESLVTNDDDLTAVLMVGGLGSRLGDLTSNCPKPMLHVTGRPILEIIVENLKEHGFRHFVFCINYRGEMIKEYFGDGSKLNVKIDYVQEPKRLGTAGALGLLSKEFKGPFLVMNGDIITKVNFTRMIESHKEQKAKATMGVRKYDFQIPFGVVKIEKSQIISIDEKPQTSLMVSAGIYLLERDCLNFIPKEEYFDMPQLFQKIMDEGDSAQAFLIHEYWLDVGREDDLIRAHVEYPLLKRDV